MGVLPSVACGDAWVNGPAPTSDANGVAEQTNEREARANRGQPTWPHPPGITFNILRNRRSART